MCGISRSYVSRIEKKVWKNYARPLKRGNSRSVYREAPAFSGRPIEVDGYA